MALVRQGTADLSLPLSMEVTLKILEKLDIFEILPLYEDAGWLSYTKNPEMLQSALKGSLAVIGAYANGRLTGLIRCVGDGYSVIYIQDILVLEEYQRQGIGGLLLEAMLDKYKAVYQTVLLTDTSQRTNAFYTKFGLKKSDDFGCSAYVRYNQ